MFSAIKLNYSAGVNDANATIAEQPDKMVAACWLTLLLYSGLSQASALQVAKEGAKLSLVDLKRMLTKKFISIMIISNLR